MLKIGDFAKLTQLSVKTLRYYARLGLLKPAWINRYNGYRFYQLEQLSQLNRILAMKELGFSLEQIQSLLSDDVSIDELRGMLKMKKAELEQHIQQEQDRLSLIRARLRQLDESGAQADYDILLKDRDDLPKEIISMQPQIVTKNAFKVVGKQIMVNKDNNEIPQLWDQMRPHWQAISNVLHPEKFYGVCGTMDEAGSFLYLAGQEVKQVGDLPPEMEVFEVPEQTYAVFPCTIPTIAETYEHAFKNWIPASEYKHVPAPDFELYDEDFDPENSQVSPLYIYIPVKEKA